MEAVSAALLVGALAVAGNWSRGKLPNITNAVGVAGVAIGLAGLQQIDGKLANGFAWLIITGMAIVHVPTIVKTAFSGSNPVGAAGSGLGLK